MLDRDPLGWINRIREADTEFRDHAFGSALDVLESYFDGLFGVGRMLTEHATSLPSEPVKGRDTILKCVFDQLLGNRCFLRSGDCQQFLNQFEVLFEDLEEL